MTFTIGPYSAVVAVSPASRRMSSRLHRWCRSAATSSRWTFSISSATVSSARTLTGIGATLTSMPPELRSTAVVRADTGIVTSTSVLPVRRAR